MIWATSWLFSGLTAVVVALLAWGVASAARRAEGRAGAGRGLGLGVAVALLVWLAATAALAQSGILAFSPDHPPLEPLLPISALVAFLLLSRSAAFQRLARSLPRWQPVALQSFRLGVEYLLWRLHNEGRAPIQMTFEGRNLDIVVGLTAPLGALGIGAGWLGWRAIVAWNACGVALLLNAIGTAATSAPGPQHLPWPGEPFTALGEWPVVWIPAFFAPTAMSLHYLSIRQALGDRATGASAPKQTQRKDTP